MKEYLQVFINFEQNNWARLLAIAKFAYNNVKNANTGYSLFELNCRYHPRVVFKKNISLCSQSKTADKLSTTLQKLITVCQKTSIMLKSFKSKFIIKTLSPGAIYVSGDKIWLNNKYIKTKQNQKLEAKFFRPFKVLHPIGKQDYKLKLPKQWKIYNIFHLSLLEQSIIQKEQINKKIIELECNAGNSQEFKVEAVWENAIYANKAEGHLPGLYYLIVWKRYFEEENT